MNKQSFSTNKKNIHIEKLANGMVLVTQQMPWVNSVSLYVAVKAGPRFESISSSGLAHFLEHMLFEGTIKHKTSKILAESIESVGGRSSAWTDKEFVSYNVKIPKEYLERGIAYLAEIFFDSSIKDEWIEKEKKIVFEEMSRTKDNPETEIWELFMEHVWGKDQSLGRSTLGNELSVKNINREKLSSYLHKFYHPGNMVICVVGGFLKENLLKNINKYFTVPANKNTVKIEPVVFVEPKNKMEIIQTNAMQTQLILGTVTGIDYFHGDRFTIRVIADVLGLGVSSRLFNKLVYELGIAYSAGVWNATYVDTGMLCVYGGFSPSNVDRAIEVIYKEFKELSMTLITKKELDMVKILDISQMYYSLETPDALASWYSTQWVTEGRILSPEDIKNEINSITPNDIQKVAEAYLKEENFIGIIRGSKA